MPCSQTTSTCQHTGERDLLCRVAARDGQAFETLYTRYAPRVRVYLTRRLKHHELVDEALNDVMFVLWQQADRCPLTVPLIAWLYGIARHKAQRVFAQTTSAAALPDVPEPASPSLGPEHTMLQDEQGHLLTRALKPMPPQERLAIQLILHQGKPYQEIAEHMQTSVNTVKSWVRRGRHRLAVRIVDLEESAVSQRCG